MKKSMLIVLISAFVVLSLMLSGCVTTPHIVGNPYVGKAGVEKIEIKTAPALIGFQDVTALRRNSNSVPLLEASLACVEDAKYEVSKQGENTEYKMTFSNAWEGDPMHEGDLVGDLLHFVVKSSAIYLYDSGLKLVDGSSGNEEGTVTTSLGTMTIVRVSSYVSLNVGNRSYPNVLKVSLSFSSYDFSGEDYSSFELDYYFVKDVGIIRFAMKVQYGGQEITIFEFDVLDTNVSSYKTSPLAVTSLETSVLSNSLTVTWAGVPSVDSYDVFLLNKDGSILGTEHVSSTVANFSLPTTGIYMCTVRSNGENGLSTLSKLKIFSSY